eukprot:9433764-Alexandrium_andersonii.AAC.1
MRTGDAGTEGEARRPLAGDVTGAPPEADRAAASKAARLAARLATMRCMKPSTTGGSGMASAV